MKITTNDKTTIELEILSETEFDADYYGSDEVLTKLGGTVEGLGLGMWTYQFEVSATNQAGQKENFTVAFQPEERNNGMQAYSGYEITPATCLGYEADESIELVAFCGGDELALNALQEIALYAAKQEYERLVSLNKK